MTEAVELNEKIICETKGNNLTALANSAFLNFYQEETTKVKKTLTHLRELQGSHSFECLKVNAIIEQAYAYRKLGGGSNLRRAIQLLSITSDAKPDDEKIQFLLALVYRRCTSLIVYIQNISSADRKTFAMEAANRLRKLGKTAKDKSIKAAAIAELAFLRRSDATKEYRLIESLEWEELIDNLSWKKLCFIALEVDKDNPNDRVLKMVGQMFKSCVDKRDCAIELLKKSISITPSSRAFHNLGLIYIKKAVDFDREARAQNRRDEEALKASHIQLRSESQQQTNQSVNQSIIELQSQHQTKLQLKSENKEQLQLQSQDEPRHQLKSETELKFQIQSETQTQLLCKSRLPYKMIQSMDERLSFCLKVPKRRLRPFSDGNPHIKNAEENLRKAVEVSYDVNIIAQYDLALFLARQCKYGEAKRICKNVIDLYTASPSRFERSLHLVNIYNLYGMCHVLEAEDTEDEETKKDLLDRSEGMLMIAIRLATEIAASVPELRQCATNLWQVFNQLVTRFTFKGDPVSKRQVFRLCELVADYRWLPELDEMLSLESFEWQDQRCLEIFLGKYLQEKAFDKADHFLNLIATRPNPIILTINNCQTLRQLRFEQVRKAIEEGYVMNPIWRKIMDEVYMKSTPDDRLKHLNTKYDDSQIGTKAAGSQKKSSEMSSRDEESITGSHDEENNTSSQDIENNTSSQDIENHTGSQDVENNTGSQDIENNTGSQDMESLFDNPIIRFHVVLVEDIDNRPDVEDGLWSCKASDCIKRSLTEKCGLLVTKLHKLRTGGVPHQISDMSKIRQSSVAIFFFDRPEAVVAQIKASGESTDDQTVEAMSHLSLSPPHGTEKPETKSPVPLNPGRKQKALSGYFENLIVCAIASMAEDDRPSLIVMAVQSDEDRVLIPIEALGKPVLVVSNEDIAVLDGSSSNATDQNELIFKIFEHLVSK